MNTKGEADVYFHTFLTSAHGGKVISFTTWLLYSRVRNSDSKWKDDRLSPISRQDILEKRKTSHPFRESNAGLPSP